MRSVNETDDIYHRFLTKFRTFTNKLAYNFKSECQKKISQTTVINQKINKTNKKVSKIRKYRFAGNLIILSQLLLSNNILSQDTLAIYNFDDNNINIFTTGAEGLNGAPDNRTSWLVGEPNGGRGYNRLARPREFVGNPDPLIDHTADNTTNYVAGQGLTTDRRRPGYSGHFNNSSEWFQLPVLNCSRYFNVTLTFWQWGNLEPGYDFAFVEVSLDGSNWNIVYEPKNMENTSWEKVSVNISNFANNESQVYIRWRTESDAEIFYSGWNIDDIVITGDYFVNDGDSYITPGNMYTPDTISSLTNTYSGRISVLDFTITDAGSGDGLPTLIDELVITQNSTNTVKNWKKAIAGASLYDAAAHMEQIGVIEKERIYFTNSSMLNITDGSSRTYILRLYLKPVLTQVQDNDKIGLTINYANFAINLDGSFIGSGIISTGENSIVVDIDATQLAFTNLPEQLVEVNRILTPVIEVSAVDVNGNIDRDFSGKITITNSENLVTTNNSYAAENGKAVFSAFTFSEAGGPTILTAQSQSPSIAQAICPVTVTIDETSSVYIFFDNFDGSGVTGWTTGNITGHSSWETGNPHGGYGYSRIPGQRGIIGNPDPTTDFTSDNSINNVYGQGLSSTSKFNGHSGYYNNSNEYLMTPAINCTDYYNTQLVFKRWANVEPDYDEAYVEISNDGNNWTALEHELYPQDQSWTTINIDISAYADRQPTVYIRWRTESDESVFYSGWNIDDVGISGLYSPTTTWTGLVSEDWSDANNWSTSTVPNEFSCVIIEPGTPYSPVIQGHAICKEVVVRIGAVLNVGAGSLDVFGDFTIETSSTDYGAVIEDNNLTINGTGIISRFLQNNKWYYISSPVKNISSNLFGNKIYSYNEPLASDNWIYGWESVVNEELEPGVGYDVYRCNDAEIKMEGEFNSGDINLTLTYTDGIEIDEHKGWNLVGNPYPSAIDWDATSGWTKYNINDAIYIWDEDKQNFVTYVGGTGVNGGTRYIPPMQGFFVKVSSPGTGILNMTNEVRILNVATKLKAASGYANELKFELSGSEYSDETVVRFKPGAKTSFDLNLDAEKKFSPNSAVPQIYSLGEEKCPLTVNTLPENDEYQTITLYQNIPVEGEYTIRIEGIAGFDYSKTIYLEDLVLDSIIDLTETREYNYYCRAVKDSARFKVHIGMPLQIKYSVQHVSENAINDGKINIRILGGVQPLLSVVWSNGSKEKDLNMIPAGEYTITLTDNDYNTYTETITVKQTMGDGSLTNIYKNSDNVYDRIYEFNNQLFVKVNPGNIITTDVMIFDLMGKVVYQDSNPRYGSFSLDLMQNQGIYIVYVINNGQVHSEKIIID